MKFLIGVFIALFFLNSCSRINNGEKEKNEEFKVSYRVLVSSVKGTENENDKKVFVDIDGEKWELKAPVDINDFFIEKNIKTNNKTKVSIRVNSKKETNVILQFRTDPDTVYSTDYQTTDFLEKEFEL